MRKIRNLFATLAAVMALMFALAPARAFAGDPYPGYDEIFVDDVPLSEAMPQGVSYDESTGTLTLDGYDGKNFHIIGFTDTFTIDVKSDSYITLNDSGLNTSPIVAMSPGESPSDLVITSSTGAELQLICTTEEESGCGGIGAWGDVRITGNLSLFIDVTSTSPNCTSNISGISSDFGNIYIEDQANVYVTIDAKSADRCAGFMMQHDKGYVFINTDGTVTVNCASTMNNGVHCCGVICSDSENSEYDAIYLANTPIARFTVDDVQGIYYGAGRRSFSDPQKPKYSLGYNSATRTTYYEAQFNQMHRFYNQWTGEHFYTSDAEECSKLIDAGWTYEGVGWCAPLNGDVVYRLYNSYAPGGDHHFTMDRDEYDYLVSIGWTGEGQAWYSDATRTRINVYREYNPYEFARNHNYTADINEHKHLIEVGWRDEGIGWYGVGFLNCQPPLVLNS